MEETHENSVPEAVYPQDELVKYKLTDTTTRGGASSDPVPLRQRLMDEGEHVHVVKVKRKSRQRVQTSHNTSNLLRRHISERSWTLRNWYAHIHWKNLTVVVIIPLIGLLALIVLHPPLLKNTFYFMIWCYIITDISINMLYHRYWSHHSFNFCNESFVQILSIICAGGGITSAKNWCSSHRAHHRYCDVTDTDPHNIRRGLFFSHSDQA